MKVQYQTGALNSAGKTPAVKSTSSVGAKLQIQNLSKTLPNNLTLLNDISFTVSTGEFVGILGASGAGKSLTLRCLLRLTEPSGGQVGFTTKDGKLYQLNASRGRALRQARRHMGVIFQGSILVKRLRVIENVMLGKLGSINPWRSWLYGFTDTEARAALAALRRVHMEDYADRYTGSLSGGEMQRVSIARAIYQEPDIYLADEPISSLDPRNARAIMELLAPLKEHGPVLGIFHQPDMVARYCTRAIGLKEGCIVYDGPPNLAPALLREIYGEELEALHPVDNAVTKPIDEQHLLSSAC
jgi:phosphonate transport system ATP-binding protein